MKVNVKKRRFVNSFSVERSLADIARETGRSKSAILATIRTLVDFGYLRAIEPGPKYLPGMTRVRLGDLITAKDPLGAPEMPPSSSAG